MIGQGASGVCHAPISFDGILKRGGAPRMKSTLFPAFYAVDQTSKSSRGDFFLYRLQQFLSFCDGSLNHFFAGGHIFHQTDGLAHGQNPGF